MWCLPVISQRVTQDSVSACNKPEVDTGFYVIPCLRVALLKSPSTAFVSPTEATEAHFFAQEKRQT